MFIDLKNAVQQGDNTEVKLILEQALFDIRSTIKDKYSLIEAIKKFHLKLVANKRHGDFTVKVINPLLVESTIAGELLYLAEGIKDQNNKIEIIELLLEHGLNPNDKDYSNQKDNINNMSILAAAITRRADIEIL